MPPRRDILSEERNIADVLSEVLTSVPGFLQQGADVRNQQLLLNLEQMTGAQERKAKSKHQRFMEEIAAGTLMQRQQAAEGRLEEQRRQFDEPKPLTELDRVKITKEEALTAKAIRETELLGEPKPGTAKAPLTSEALRQKVITDLFKETGELPEQSTVDSVLQFIETGQFPPATEEPSGIEEFFNSLLRSAKIPRPIGFEGIPAETTRVSPTNLDAQIQKEKNKRGLK